MEAGNLSVFFTIKLLPSVYASSEKENTLKLLFWLCCKFVKGGKCLSKILSLSLQVLPRSSATLIVCSLQMNGIDEAALDNLSLVTEMTKHIRVRASSSATSANELGQFSPLFVWLLRVRHSNVILCSFDH